MPLSIPQCPARPTTEPRPAPSINSFEVEKPWFMGRGRYLYLIPSLYFSSRGPVVFSQRGIMGA